MEKKYTKKQIDEKFLEATEKVLNETQKQVERFMKEENIKDASMLASHLMSTTLTLAQFKHYFWEDK